MNLSFASFREVIVKYFDLVERDNDKKFESEWRGLPRSIRGKRRLYGKLVQREAESILQKGKS
jgi:hypothetical protein